MKKRIRSLLGRADEKVPCVWTGREVMRVLLLIVIVPFIVGIPLYMLIGPRTGRPALVAAQPVLFIYLVWSCVRKKHGLPMSAIGLHYPVAGVKEAAWAVAAAWAINMALVYAGMSVMGTSHPAMSGAMGAESIRWPGTLAYAFAGLIGAPVAEEALIRGLLYRWLRSKTSMFRAMAIQAVAFALLHLDASPGYYLIPFFLHLFSGVLYVLVLEFSGSLYASMILHGSINLASMLLWGIL